MVSVQRICYANDAFHAAVGLLEQGALHGQNSITSKIGGCRAHGLGTATNEVFHTDILFGVVPSYGDPKRGCLTWSFLSAIRSQGVYRYGQRFKNGLYSSYMKSSWVLRHLPRGALRVCFLVHWWSRHEFAHEGNPRCPVYVGDCSTPKP